MVVEDVEATGAECVVLDLENAGQASRVALPPYFPVDRNEAFILVGRLQKSADVQPCAVCNP